MGKNTVDRGRNAMRDNNPAGVGKILEHRERREQGQCNGNQWHQRQQRGKGQARRDLYAAILMEAQRDEAHEIQKILPILLHGRFVSL